MKAAYLTFLLIFILALLGSLIRQDWRERRRGIHRVRATVIGHALQRDPTYGISYAPTFRIEEGPDAGTETTDPVFSTKPRPAVGTPVIVVYATGDPRRAHLPHPWIRPLSYASLLLFLVVVTALLLHR